MRYISILSLFLFSISDSAFSGDVNSLNPIANGKEYDYKKKVCLSSSPLESLTVSSIKNEELDKIFNACFLQRGEENFSLLSLENIYKEKKKRGIASISDKNYLRRVFVELREFEKLKKFEKEELNHYSQISLMNIDRLNGADPKHIVYDIKDLKTAKLKNIELNDDKKIVFLMSLSCPVSERALDYIFMDQKARMIFKKYGVILTLDFAPESFLFFKKHYNFDNIYSVYSSKSFKNLSFDAYPKIYFLNKGEIVDLIDGWDEESLKEFLKKASNYPLDINKKVNVSYDNLKLVETIEDVLSPLSYEDKKKFLKTLSIKRCIITSFDYNILRKHLKQEEVVNIIDAFTPFSIRLEKVKDYPEKNIYDVVSVINEEEREKFILSLQIHKGAIKGCFYPSPMDKLSQKDLRFIKCNIFGECPN